MVEQMASDEILTGITGDPMWADNCENVAFNTYPAAVMPDFKSLRYLTAPNMVMSDSQKSCARHSK
ncbi:MAG: beta-L-arabinofuranosidase domain-containing protein [Segetibacter sp.]